ncbi:MULTISPECIES: hypothetical protein [Kitasatospora]|uniref:Polyketide cyclase/dehydrase n=1 Tax=Kitasatospora setae (strain ATCC 33774 / DSM 43861 / JCM 3304 / KCC A-0304 / NBRC 14216 / KM-6054) TaxID=452652 RepID=E4NDM9_KITSK|nr:MULTISPECIES: hypothetical protein [Kitasatospora]BAJ29310.1 hypothetical protein KSE_35030 [Kitasatospora setae KM-6054]
MPEPNGAAGWPVAELGALGRLRVIAGATDGAFCATRRFDAPPELVWEVAADLEHELPHLLPGVRSFTPEAAVPDGERFRAVAVSRLGHRETFEVLLRPGWCLMRSRILLGAMAAEPEDGGTRFGYLTGYRLPGGGRLGGGVLGALRRPGAGARGEALFERLRRRIEARGA